MAGHSCGCGARTRNSWGRHQPTVSVMLSVVAPARMASPSTSYRKRGSERPAGVCGCVCGWVWWDGAGGSWWGRGAGIKEALYRKGRLLSAWPGGAGCTPGECCQRAAESDTPWIGSRVGAQLMPRRCPARPALPASSGVNSMSVQPMARRLRIAPTTVSVTCGVAQHTRTGDACMLQRPQRHAQVRGASLHRCCAHAGRAGLSWAGLRRAGPGRAGSRCAPGRRSCAACASCGSLRRGCMGGGARGGAQAAMRGARAMQTTSASRLQAPAGRRPAQRCMPGLRGGAHPRWR